MSETNNNEELTKKLWRFIEKSDDSIIAMVSIALLPLLPMLIELILTEDISQRTLYLTACMYPITVGARSSSRAVRLIDFVIGVIGAIIFGSVIYNLGPDGKEDSDRIIGNIYGYICIIFPFLIFLLELKEGKIIGIDKDEKHQMDD